MDTITMKNGKIYRIEPADALHPRVAAGLSYDLDNIAADLTIALQALNRASDNAFDLFAKLRMVSAQTVKPE